MLQSIAMTLLSLLLAHAGCGPVRTPADTATPPANQAIPPDTEITLERTACFGFCPVYKLTIKADGGVVFEGKKYVKSEGTHTARISADKLQTLVAAFEKINFFSLSGDYTMGSEECPNAHTDAPSAITTLKMKGRQKRVNHYHGCGRSKVLQDLSALESLIDEVANTRQWIQ